MDPCPKGTAASYAGQSYWLGDPSIVLAFPQTWYTCLGDVELTPDQVLILLDPKGPNTLLISTNGRWNLDQPQKHVKLYFDFTVTGSTVSQGWQHGATITADATVMCATIVGANPPLRSNSYLTPQGKKEQGDPIRYDLGSQSVEVVIELQSNGGSCRLATYGLHFG